MLWFILFIIFVFYVVFSLITIKTRLTGIEKKLGLYDLPNISDEEMKQRLKKEHEQAFFDELNKQFFFGTGPSLKNRLTIFFNERISKVA